GTDVSGQFFASAQGKFSGPIEAQRHPHLHDRASQEAAWQAVVKVSGIDFVRPSILERGVLKEALIGESLDANQHCRFPNFGNTATERTTTNRKENSYETVRR
ncbi:MAG: hypothetical protein WB711_24230, partial [Terriglobales bacterium]